MPFEIGQQIVIDDVVFRLRKITKKDILLRPIGRIRRNEGGMVIAEEGKKNESTVGERGGEGGGEAPTTRDWEITKVPPTNE